MLDIKRISNKSTRLLLIHLLGGYAPRHMGDYTSIHFTPVDRTWVAPVEFIRGVAATLGASSFDSFTVQQEDPAFDGDEFDEDDRFTEVVRLTKLPIEEALPQHRAGGGYWTHMMFRFGDFMQALTREVFTTLPESLTNNYSPWDTSLYNGYWQVWSPDTGEREDGGACSFTMSADGCPSDLSRYLEQLLAVEGVVRLQSRLESLSGLPWTATINLT